MSFLTPANQLTLTRVMLAPAFVILTVYGYFGWALIVFAVAGLTDLFDGLLARKMGSRTSLGTWLDPMADKLLIVATVSVLTVPGLGLVNKLPVWLTILIISRDLLIVLTVAVINLAIGRREFRPSIYGKTRHGDLHRHLRPDHVFQLPAADVDRRDRRHLRLRGHYADLRLSLRVHGDEDDQSELNHEDTKTRRTRSHEVRSTKLRRVRCATSPCACRLPTCALRPRVLCRSLFDR